MGIKRFLKKAGKRLDSAGQVFGEQIKGGFKNFKDNPIRLAVGSVDPASTKLWNTILGRDDKPLTNAFGSPTKDNYRSAEARGVDTRGARDFFRIGDSIAGFYGGGAALNGLGNIPGSVGNGATAAGGLETFPVTGGNAPLGSAAGAGGGAGATSSGIGNFLGNYGQYIGPVLGAAGQIYGANQAAKGAEAGIDESRRQYDQSRKDLERWRLSGEGALGDIGSVLGIGPDGNPVAPDMSRFTLSPDYKFTMDENLKAVQGSAAAAGGLYSGNALKAIQDRSANVASGEFTNFLNRRLALAGLGQTAASNTVASGDNSAATIAQLLGQRGDARGSGIAGAANILGNAAGQYGGMYYQRNRPSYYGAG